ncbi:MAG: hypothetical protein IIT51_00330, partial [Oscillospiraceae bacterium]|nr:hypothetical protein [Oscillospiraceae bacterium]
TVISRRLEGEFLNYRRSIPDSFKYPLKVDKGELMSSIDRVSLIVSEYLSGFTVQDLARARGVV